MVTIKDIRKDRLLDCEKKDFGLLFFMFLSIISIFSFGLYFQKDSKKRFVVTEKMFLRIFANLISAQKGEKRGGKCFFRSFSAWFVRIHAYLSRKRCFAFWEKMPMFAGKGRLFFSRYPLFFSEWGGFFGKNFRMERKNGIRGLKMPDIFSGMKIFTNHHFLS